VKLSYSSSKLSVVLLVLLTFLPIPLALVDTITIGVSASSLTFVDYDIVEDTVWTKDRSPYRIVKDIEIKARLVVEPGVVVELGGYVTIYVTGSIVARGTPEEPIVFTVINPVAYATIVVSKGYAVFENVVFKEKFSLQIRSGKAEIRNFETNLISIRIEHSTLTIENGKASSVLFSPSYCDRYKASESSVYNSTLIMRNIFVENYIAGAVHTEDTIHGAYILGKTGFDRYRVFDTPYICIVRSNLVMENVTSIIGIAFSSRHSIVQLNRVVTREMVVWEIGNSNVSIVNSVIAWGRGILIYEVYGATNIVMKNTSLYNLYLFYQYQGFEKAGIIIYNLYNSHNVFFDFRYNWWGDSTGPTNSNLNPEGRGALMSMPSHIKPLFYPWLEKPPAEIPDINISIEFTPPIAIGGLNAVARVKPPLEGVYYLFIVEAPYGESPLVVNTTLKNEISFVVPKKDYKYEVSVTVIVFYRGVVIGALRKILVLPYLKGEIQISEPTMVFAGTSSVEFVVSVDTFKELLPYLSATLFINETSYEMVSLRNGTFVQTLNLPEGAYTWRVLVTYFGHRVTELYSRDLVVDVTPPLVNATWKEDREKLTIQYNVLDELSGLALIEVYVNGILHNRLTLQGQKQSSRSITVLQRPPLNITIVANDRAGNTESYTMLIPLPSSITMTKPTYTTPTTTPVEIVTTSPAIVITTTTATSRTPGVVELPWFTEESTLKIVSSLVLGIAILIVILKRVL